MHELEPSLTQVQNRNASSNRQQTAVTRDLRRAEDKIKRHVRAYKRARQGGASLLDPLQDTIYVMKVVPDEALNAGILGKDFIIETVRAGRAWNGVCLRRRLSEGSGSIPSVSV